MFDSLTKLTLIIRTHYVNLDTNDLITKILDENILIRSIAKEEFLKRDFSNLNISDEILKKVIDKLSIEDIWFIASTKQNNHFVNLVIEKLNEIFLYYEKNYPDYYLLKVNEKDKILNLIKK